VGLSSAVSRFEGRQFAQHREDVAARVLL